MCSDEGRIRFAAEKKIIMDFLRNALKSKNANILAFATGLLIKNKLTH
jgi:hypothetical protein